MIESLIPEDIFKLAIPLTELDETDAYVLHYYKGFNPIAAQAICEKFLKPVVEKYNIEQVHVYLYVVNCVHNYDNDLTRENCNNGFTLFSGNFPCYVSIVIFRYLFWPKVLLHEIFHIIWKFANLPDCRSLSPKYDESIVEYYAIQYAVSNGYINEREYSYYLNTSRQKVLENVIKKTLPPEKDLMFRLGNKRPIALSAGSVIQEEMINEIIKNQHTFVAEYLFLIEKISALNASPVLNPAYTSDNLKININNKIEDSISAGSNQVNLKPPSHSRVSFSPDVLVIDG